MTQQIIINKIIEGLLTIGLLVITGILVPKLKELVDSKINNIKMQTATEELLKQVDVAVNYIEQTMVTQLKEEGKWDSQKQKKVLFKATKSVISNLSNSTIKYLSESRPDIEGMIVEYIESNISTKGSK